VIEQSASPGARPYSTITVVTPCLNGAPYIRETVESVLHNSAVVEGAIGLQYIFCDGSSTDGTQDIVETIFAASDAGNVELELLSEPDGGMYDALVKGLARCKGDICCYVNADDFFAPKSFEIVRHVFRTYQVRWLTGMHVFYNERSHVVGAETPFRYQERLIRCGLYGTVLPAIQQESTFWDAGLHALLDLERLSRIKVAGDYYMWKQFSQAHPLYVVEAWLGGFRYRRGQLTERMDRYLDEMSSIREQPGPADYARALVDKMLWHLPTHWKKRLNPRFLFVFDRDTQTYR
jgi:glycosyltransferase involved in cell wall biosynthesis